MTDDTAAQIGRLVSKRGTLKGRLTKFIKFINDPNNITNIAEIQSRLRVFESAYTNFLEIHDELVILDGNNSDRHNDELNSFDDSYFRIVGIATTLIEDSKVTPSAAISTPVVNTIANLAPPHFLQLPAMPLPQFSGSYEDWSNFNDTFKSLINNYPSMPTIQKFHLLKSCLKQEAAHVIDSLEVNDNNYLLAWNLLTDRFENKRFIIKTHIQYIFDLPNVTKDSHKSLRLFTDLFLKHFRALNSLNEPVNSWSTLLIHLLTTKLDVPSKREWEIKTANEVSPSIEKFIEFLTNRCHLLESIDTKPASLPQSSTQKPYNSFTNKPVYQNTNYSNNKHYNNTQKPVSHHNNHNISHNSQSQTFVSTFKSHCAFCNANNHYIQNCGNFLKLNISDRFSEIKKINACTNCLRKGHNNSECNSSLCRLCNRRHHTLLHFPTTHSSQSQPLSNIATSSQVKLSDQNTHTTPLDSNNTNTNLSIVPVTVSNNHVSTILENQNDISMTLNSHCIQQAYSLLSTALIYIYDSKNNPVLCRALLDNASQSHLMTMDLFRQLNLKPTKVNIPMLGINNTTSFISLSTMATIKSRFSNFKPELLFLVINEFPGKHVPQFDLDTSSFAIPEGINLADPDFYKASKVDVILGVNIFYKLLLSGQIITAPKQPDFQNTKLGWVIGGSLANNSYNNKIAVQCHLAQTNDQTLHNILETFWKIEDAEVKSVVYSVEENMCETHFAETHTRDSRGNFIVKLPFKENALQLGDSQQLAIQRFKGLERKLSKNPQLKTDYCKFINEYLDLGHMRLLNNSDLNKPEHFYLPHHCVLKESSVTTKLRVVFDGSAKTTSNVSLNNILMVGPNIQQDMFSIMTRFRIRKICVTADIAKMYRCVKVADEDQNFQRIIWRFNNDEPLQHYKLTTVTYGLGPSSFLATRCLKQLALDNKDKHPQASKSILGDFYVDDYICTSDNIDDAFQLITEVRDILCSAGFDLRQWNSNNQTLLNLISNSKNTKMSEYVLKDPQNNKTLGLIWNPDTDKFKIVTNNRHSTLFTKRIILSIVGQIFDVLGLIGPVILRAKVFLQELWKQHIDWDEEIPCDLLNKWLAFYKNLHVLNNLRVPRHTLLENPCNIQIHVFSDASQIGYGAAIYLRSEDLLGNTNVSLLCSKSRVAPVKPLTLPRLELSGAHLAAKLHKKVLQSINLNVNFSYFWCDSTIVLAWLGTDPCKLKTFVCNRVSQIQNLTEASEWKYVPSESNPADLVSRGMNPDELINNETWFSGPKWLLMSAESWPTLNHKINVLLPDLKSQPLLSCVVIKPDFNILYEYSSFQKLLHLVAYLLRFKHNSNPVNRDCKLIGDIAIFEINCAEIAVIKLVQLQSFEKELNSLKNKNKVSRKSKLYNLSPFLDENGIIRVGGRLKNSKLPLDAKHQILLPSQHHVTKILINQQHLKNLHAGAQLVLSELRKKYWPLHGRRTVRGVLSKCIVCFRVKPLSTFQKMADLPCERVNISRPFTNVGIDYAGYYLMKDSKLRNKTLIKSYICIFICLSTKAIHIELVSDLTAQSFLSAFKRFTARRGLCANIFSDNATNFIGANSELSAITKLPIEQSFKRYLLENRIAWKYIPPRSPHCGGLWESAVRLTKFHLKRIMSNITFCYEDFLTILTQVESIVNSRPLFPLTEDPCDLEALTPGHFLIGSSLLAVPEAPVADNRHTHASRYRHMQWLIQQFWNHWSKDYLQSLQVRSKWQSEQANVAVGDMVVLCEEGTPPLNWKMGRVSELHPGQDNLVRVVTIKTSSGMFKRAVSRICVLPIERIEDKTV